ncbi:acyl-CoA carboxylase subunit epsilon [Protaetiibacter mangrovi]|uniref:Acyl-CoA carboxylase subunit epsilon n=1 Tax=Protaetiibacter mangrovi TaxID=2970926 RepID=A0ABT1ZFL7_9MICO|nr:acyl-CoA carboxylase subunit epsilon [Protaetiibacter mangrovi]MCS0499499.1 acyl-CoA carboxylase subunit epsilon [Protaetiibacter mangrovi]TPX05555.1 acyl-CoA carboxylase subunit epsilon [Schumannella luteola]
MTEQEQPLTAQVRVVGGDPTPEELAATTAVLQAALDELAGMHRRAHRSPTRWQRESKGLRAPLEPGAWNRWAR